MSDDSARSTPASAAHRAERPRAPISALLRRAERGLRRVAAKLTGPRAAVVFHAGYTVPDNAIADARRAAKILDHTLAEGWLLPTHVEVPPPLELSALRRVHDDTYLEALDTPAAVARALGGIDPPPPAMAERYLRAQRWATAGTVHATRLALRRRGVAVSLGGGFHHAERDRGGGFCLFNDIAVAIEDARARGFTGRVLVMDLDLHQGDGTRRIYRDDPNVVAASVHATAWDDEPLPNAIDIALGSGAGDATYLTAVRDLLDRALARGEPDLVMYVAGVDVSINDTLGSFRVTPDAIAERDRLIIERLRGRPLAMVLAGGYGPDAWRCTARTVAWLLSGRDRPIPAQIDVELSRFRRVARTLGEEQLSARPGGDDNFGITEEDLLGDLVKKGRDDQLLGYYTAFGLELAFERYGLFPLLRERGYPHPRVELNLHAGSGESVTVRAGDAGRLVLVELVVREMREVTPYRLLSIEWLLLQDPRARPTPDRPLLPGQDHPGLGALRIVVGMLAMAAERLRFDGLTFVPAHYHTAAQARGLLRFIDPRDEARFACIREATAGRRLSEITRLLETGRLNDRATGAPAGWKPGRMVLPVSDALRAAVAGHEYDKSVEEAARQRRLSIVES